MKKYFSVEFLEFFKNLAANNHKEWFDVNRKTYENFVKQPFQHFIQELIEQLRAEGFVVAPEAKDAIFRINRDIRFSKDKTPYKIYASALLSPKGRKDIAHPGFYLEFSPEQFGIYAGVYSPDNQQIAKIRKQIINFPENFKTIIENKSFVELYGGILGEKQVRLPKEWQKEAENQPLLYNKQWYINAVLPSETILSTELMSIVLKYFHTALPLHNYFTEALD